MSGGRPDKDTARRMGIVPHNGASNEGSNRTGSGSYPNISSNKSSNFAGNPAAPAGAQENVKNAGQGGNNQLWSNGSANYNQPGANSNQGANVNQGSAPAWPGSNNNQPGNQQQGVPVNPGNSFDSRQTAAGPTGAGGGYIQGNQPGAQPGVQQQQQANFQGKNVQDGIPVSSHWNNQQGGPGFVQGAPVGNNSQPGSQRGNAQGPQGGYLTDSTKRSVPKGDYVYYDGQGNQMQPGGAAGPQGQDGSGSERHFHHHYYYGQPQQQQQQQAPAYPYNKSKEQKKKRSRGANALAAALITCWACTCCCHAPCGW